jgi:uncharacterized protein YqeY
MNYIKNDLNKLILESMKAGEKLKTEAFRAIKTAFMNWETAKENVGKELDEQVELQILRKMVASYKDAADQCNDGKHDALVQENLAYAKIIESLLPAAASEEDIQNAFDTIKAEGIEPVKKNMGVFIKQIKQMLPTADGKTVSTIVTKNLV